MKTFTPFRVLALALCCGLVFFGCDEDEILDIENTNLLNSDIVNGSVTAQQGAVNAAYAPLRNLGLYARWGFYLEDHMSDELTIQIPQPSIQRISDHLLDATTVANTQYYNACYQGVNLANNVIANAENWTTGEDIVTPFVAEARFMRGLYYFLLASRFGDVPLRSESVTEFVPLSPQAEVYAFIAEDFQFAAENLADRGATELGRPSNESAYGMLGKIQLYRENWQAAFDAFDQVVSYSLMDEYTANFDAANEYNDESLFEVGFTLNGNTQFVWSNRADQPSVVTFRSTDYSAWTNSKPSDKMLAEYEPFDSRQDDTFWQPGDPYGGEGSDKVWGTDADGGPQGFGGPGSGTVCSRKYSEYIDQPQQTQQFSGVNPRLLRYADVLLMKAEAAMRLNRLDEAVSLMNEVRARPSVDMPPYGSLDMDLAGFPVSTQDEVFEAIQHERMIELALEGHRLRDLQRWGIDQRELAALKPAYGADRRFLPIPQGQINSNPLIGGE